MRLAARGSKIAFIVLGSCTAAWAQTTHVASVDSSGQLANAWSVGSSVSDGGDVVFQSVATNLVAGDTNGWADVFLHHRVSGVTELVDVSPSGAPGDRGAHTSSVSADARFVAFVSASTNLVAGVGNDRSQVFVRDRIAGTTECLSLDPTGAPGDSDSHGVILSADGRFVAFASEATNLIAGDVNGFVDVFVVDRSTGAIECVSTTALGGAANENSFVTGHALSDDGRYVVFWSDASNLVANDTNQSSDVFVRDRQTAQVERISVSSNGVEGDCSGYYQSITGDGRFVAFQSCATNLVANDTNASNDIFVRDRLLGVTERVSLGANGVQGDLSSSGLPWISDDGRWITFFSDATNLVANDTNDDMDVFVRDRWTGTTELACVNSYGVPADNFSQSPSLSRDGRFVGFESYAGNLTIGVFHELHIYLRDRWGCTPSAYCTAKVNSLGCTPLLTWDGTPSVSPPSGFTVRASQVLANEFGLLFYGTNVPAAAPFQGGQLCVLPAKARTTVQHSGSSGAPPCTGTYAYDFDALIQSGADPALVLGRQVCVQYWSRDPAASFGSGLTGALVFVIGP